MTGSTRKQFVKELAKELSELAQAVHKMVQDTFPNTPLGKAKIFWFCKGVSWPRIDKEGVSWGLVKIDELSHYFLYTFPVYNEHIAEIIIERAGGQLRKVLRSIRRIQAATAWCLARAEGRKRAVQEILRQQRKAIEALKAEAALDKLSE